MPHGSFIFAQLLDFEQKRAEQWLLTARALDLWPQWKMEWEKEEKFTNRSLAACVNQIAAREIIVCGIRSEAYSTCEKKKISLLIAKNEW